MIVFHSELAERVRREVRDIDGLGRLFYDAAETERRMPRAIDLRVKN